MITTSPVKRRGRRNDRVNCTTATTLHKRTHITLLFPRVFVFHCCRRVATFLRPRRRPICWQTRYARYPPAYRTLQVHAHPSEEFTYRLFVVGVEAPSELRSIKYSHIVFAALSPNDKYIYIILKFIMVIGKKTGTLYAV